VEKAVKWLLYHRATLAPIFRIVVIVKIVLKQLEITVHAAMAAVPPSAG